VRARVLLRSAGVMLSSDHRRELLSKGHGDDHADRLNPLVWSVGIRPRLRDVEHTPDAGLTRTSNTITNIALLREVESLPASDHGRQLFRKRYHGRPYRRAGATRNDWGSLTGMMGGAVTTRLWKS